MITPKDGGPSEEIRTPDAGPCRVAANDTHVYFTSNTGNYVGRLDKATRDQLNRGEKLSEIVKQPQYQPLAVEKQTAILYAATKGQLDDVPTPKVKDFETQFYRFLETERPSILTDLAKGKALTDEIAAALDEALVEFRKAFLA